MYENMTVLTTKEYAELVIKAHKYEEMDKKDYKEIAGKAKIYDILRAEALCSPYITSHDKILFGITDAEIETYKKQEG